VLDIQIDLALVSELGMCTFSRNCSIMDSTDASAFELGVAFARRFSMSAILLLHNSLR